MEAALHEQLGLALAHERDGHLRRCMAMRYVDNLEASEVETTGLRELPDMVSGTHKQRNYQPGTIRLERAAERGLIARVSHGRCESGVLSRRRDQPLVLVVSPQLR